MSTDIVSRWPVVMSLPVEADDGDAKGYLTDTATGRLRCRFYLRSSTTTGILRVVAFS